MSEQFSNSPMSLAESHNNIVDDNAAEKEEIEILELPTTNTTEKNILK